MTIVQPVDLDDAPITLWILGECNVPKDKSVYEHVQETYKNVRILKVIRDKEKAMFPVMYCSVESYERRMSEFANLIWFNADQLMSGYWLYKFYRLLILDLKLSP